MEDEKEKSPRGFALMTPERRTEMARLGGVRAHQLGTGHKWTREAAAEAGRKGGKAKRRSGRAA